MKSTSLAGLLFLAAGTSATACTSILGGFVFDTSTGTGGAGTTTTGSTTGTGGTSGPSTTAGTGGVTTTTGSSSSAGGADAAGPTCTSIGSLITVISPTELGASMISQLIVLVPDPGVGAAARPVVHVAVGNQGGGAMYARTVNGQSTNPTGPLVAFAAAMATGSSCTQASDCVGSDTSCVGGMCYTLANDFAPVAGWVTPGSALVLQGYSRLGYDGQPGGLAELSFPISENQNESVQPSPAPTYTPWSTPTDCEPSNGQVNNIALTPAVNGDSRYAVSCADQNNNASLWVGDSDPTTTPTLVTTGMKQDLLQGPTAYSYVNNEHFIAFQYGGSGIGPGGYTYGSDPTTLAASEVGFNLVTGQDAVPMSLVPLPTNDGFALFLASIDGTNLNSASMWGGSVTPSQYASLAMLPPPSLQQLYTTSTVLGVAGLQRPTTDATHIYFAGATLGQTQINLSWTLRDGTPLVMEQNIYTTQNATCMTSHTCNTILAAGAAPMGTGVLVAWTEQSAGQPPTYTVNALSVLCTGG